MVAIAEQPEQQITRYAGEFAAAIEQFRQLSGATDDADLVDRIEAYVAGFEQADCPVNDHFFDGLYGRETFVPGGTVFVTEEHMTTHPLFLMQGTITLWTKGSEGVTLHAPCVVRTTPGTRRVVFAHSDTVGITVHATAEKDPEAIRAQITSQRPNPFLPCLG